MSHLGTEVGVALASVREGLTQLRARFLEKYLAAFTPQQEGQEPWNGLWKSILKRWRRPPAAVARDSCGDLAKVVVLEGKMIGLTNLEGR